MAEATAIAPASPPPSTPTPAPPPKPKNQQVDSFIKGRFPDFSRALEGEVIPEAKPVQEKPERKAERNLSDMVFESAQASPAATDGTVANPDKPAEPPVAAVSTTPPAPAAPAPEPPPVKVVKAPRINVDDIVSGVTDALRQQQVAQPAPVAATTTAPDVDPFEASLNDDQKERLEFARDAAKLEPAKYGSLPAQTLAFFKSIDGYIARKAADGSDHNDDDPEFLKFVSQSKPKISDGEIRRIERRRILEEAKTSVRAETQTELEATRKQIREIELKPKVEKVASDFAHNTMKYLAETKTDAVHPIVGTVVSKAMADGWDKAVDEDPVFAPIVRNIHARGTEYAALYTRLAGNPSEFRSGNPDHEWLVNFIKMQGEHFKENGGDARIRVGKNGARQSFLPVGEFNVLAQRDTAKAASHWTFGDDDILLRLGQNTVYSIQSRVKEQEETFKKAGYSRQTQAAPSQETPKPATHQQASQKPPEPTSAPRATPTLSPGVAKTPSPPNPVADTMRQLGIRVPVPA